MDTNLGEEVYPQCIRYLLDEHIQESVEFIDLDLYGRVVRCEDNTTKQRNERLMGSRAFNRIERKIIKEYIPEIEDPEKKKHAMWNVNPNNRRRLYKIYYEKIKGADLVLFAGGGLIECSLNHDYYHHIDLITKIANRLKVPVCFNAVGRVLDTHYMYGWKIMRKALRRRCVKYITCRDGAEWIDEYCFNGRRKIETIPCAAIFTADAYNTKKNDKTEMIGIGAIRENIFSSYQKNISKEEMLQLYMQIVLCVKQRGYNCCLFTNGYSRDYEFALKVKEELNKEGVDITVLERPENSRMLIEQLINFRGIITARLHSCIMAYSLKIPAIAISWTDKISDFMNLIDCPEAAVKMENLNAEYIVDLFERQLNAEYDEIKYHELREQVMTEIERISSYMK